MANWWEALRHGDEVTGHGGAKAYVFDARPRGVLVYQESGVSIQFWHGAALVTSPPSNRQEATMADSKLRLDRPENSPPKPERAELEELRDWELIQDNGADDRTERLIIVGGSLYRTVTKHGVALVFSPAERLA